MTEQGRTNYYAVLGVGREATPEELRRAYRAVAFTCHPDRNPDNPEAMQRFKAASEAYQVLTDPERRVRFDRGDDLGLFGASAAREVARRRVERAVLDHLRNLRSSTTAGGTSP